MATVRRRAHTRDARSGSTRPRRQRARQHLIRGADRDSHRDRQGALGRRRRVAEDQRVLRAHQSPTRWGILRRARLDSPERNGSREQHAGGSRRTALAARVLQTGARDRKAVCERGPDRAPTQAADRRDRRSHPRPARPYLRRDRREHSVEGVRGEQAGTRARVCKPRDHRPQRQVVARCPASGGEQGSARADRPEPGRFRRRRAKRGPRRSRQRCSRLCEIRGARLGDGDRPPEVDGVRGRPPCARPRADVGGCRRAPDPRLVDLGDPPLATCDRDPEPPRAFVERPHTRTRVGGDPARRRRCAPLIVVGGFHRRGGRDRGRSHRWDPGDGGNGASGGSSPRPQRDNPREDRSTREGRREHEADRTRAGATRCLRAERPAVGHDPQPPDSRSGRPAGGHHRPCQRRASARAE